MNRLAIFDFDGTIADSRDWFFGVLNEVCHKFSIRQISLEERERLRDLSSREIISEINIPAWKIPLIAAHLRKRAADEIDQIQLFPWVSDLLHQISGDNIQIAIVSSNSEANIRNVLGKELAKLINFYSTGTSLFGKASRIEKAIKKCRSTPVATVSIGDEVRDIEAAHTANVNSIAVTWGYASETGLKTAIPNKLVHNSDDLLSCIMEQIYVK